MHNLKLQLIFVAEFVEGFLAGQQGFGIEIELVIQILAAAHLCVECFSIHGDLISRARLRMTSNISP
jgi:hypothetical protein